MKINGSTKASVMAQSFLRTDGSPVAVSRAEVIDLERNTIFARVSTVLELKEAYESFWNHLNDTSEEIVFVQSIELVP